jgi:type II secretory pathway component PulJ
LPVTRVLHRLRDEESGFTLVEMLVACIIGTTILLASFMMLDSSVVLTGKVTDRVDRTQRARLAMEQVTRELRSQVCPSAGNPALIDAQGNSITFYAFMGSGAFVPDKFQILWDSSSNSIIENKWAGSGAAPSTTWAATPTQRTLLTDVKPPPPTGPMFAYYVSGGASPLATPLSAANLATTSKIAVTFMTYASGRNATGSSVTLQSEVFARTADPSGPTGSTAPDCA